MNKVRLDILGLSSSQSQSGSFALVLGEIEGNRRLPIIIGMFEAQAIAIELEKITPNRPMTHDLFVSFGNSFNFRVEEVIISDLREGVFYAKLVCTDDNKTIEIDARPSDAMAIGLRFGAPIYTYEFILSEAGIVLTDEEEDEQEENTPAKKSSEVPVSPSSKTDTIKSSSFDQLQQMLNEALENEDYEKAARIRDEMNKRN